MFSITARKRMSESALKRHRREGNIKGGKGNLHHTVWNKHHPEDPIKKGDGFIIHHKDFNHDNNDPNNLQKVTLAEHIKIHHKGKIVSKESRDKMSASQKGNKNTLGHKHTEESKRKMRLSHIGRRPSQETIQKRSAKLKGIPRPKEVKNKIAESVRKSWAKRKVWKYDI